jgi:glycosyltransferase involved in cell wall biosynthesis
LGFIGRIEDVKGVPLIFKAVSLLKEASNIEIVLAGRETSKGYLRSLAEKYPTVVWRHLGFVRPHDFYSQCDCVIVPSTWAEPFPAVAYEPFEYGVPVLGSDLGGISEIVENEVSGLLFSAGDAEDLSRKIERILSTPALHARLQRGALAAWQRFSPSERMTNQYRRIIEEVAKN